MELYNNDDDLKRERVYLYSIYNIFNKLKTVIVYIDNKFKTKLNQQLRLQYFILKKKM